MKFSEFLKKDRDNLLIRVISFFWILSKLWIQNAWLPSRTTPTVPLIPDIGNAGDLILVSNIISISLLFFLMFNVKRWAVLFVILCEFISIICDYLFLQPWEYIYLVIFFVHYVYWSNTYKRNFIIQLFIASVYIFSGLHKLDRIFLTTVWNRIFLNEYFGIAQETVLQYKLFFLGLIIPFIEIAIGIFFLISKFSRTAGYFIVITHVVILLMVDPLGLKANSVIWIWNTAMIAVILYLLWKKYNPVRINVFWYAAIFAAPLLTFFLGSTSYLTFNLFTGKNDQVYIHSKDKFPPEYQAAELPLSEKPYRYYINLQEVVMGETGLPPTPEEWYQKRMIQQFKQKFRESRIIVVPPPN